MAPAPRFFESPSAFRAWLKANHAAAAELIVGYYKVGTGRPSITWPQSVAEALCYGWIDGLTRRLDDERYAVRFTPRRKSSMWSAVNIRLVAQLEAAGRMADAGRAAFEARPHKTGPKAKGYTVSKKVGRFDAARAREFKKHADAWRFFEAQPPGYKRAMAWWVMQAKRDETRDRRLAKLIAFSAAGKRVT